MPSPTQLERSVGLASPASPNTVSDGHTAFLHDVRSVILLSLIDGHPRIRRTAACMQSSVRTLQRRFSRAGLTYTGMVDEVRFAEARRLMANRHMRLLDIAKALEFADAGSFTRAFERWAGTTPRIFRSGL